MEEMGSSTQLIMIIAITIVGVSATVVYYFSRYYFRTHEKDNEVLGESQLVDVTETSTENSKKPVELKEALSNTRNTLLGRITSAFKSDDTSLDGDLEYLEEILYTSDLGPQTVQRLISSVGEKLNSDEKKNIDKLTTSLREEMNDIFSEVAEGHSQWVVDKVKEQEKPYVILVVGVNGAGKTTTIGKLANLFAKNGLKTLVAAGDTFRAAADKQLQVWSERAEVEIFSLENTKDPSAVAFDACSFAKSKNFDTVIIDTAGRLHTQDNLMEELKKMKRVLTKVLPEAPNDTFIVLDANSGQNALVQAKTFNQALELTGAVLTKLDGTAKGGVALGLACELALPIKMIGVGEGIDDVRPFNAKEFVESII